MPLERRIQDVTHTSFYGENPNRNRYLSYINSRYSPTDHELFVNDLSDPKKVRNLVSTVQRRQARYWGQPFDHRMRMETDVHSPSYYTYMAYIYGSNFFTLPWINYILRFNPNYVYKNKLFY